MKDEERNSKIYAKFKVQCKCGTKTIMPMYVDKLICRGCGNYVYRDKKQEFKDNLLKELKKC